ncbi:MAG: DUF4062 domain-containing protein [Lachnospiraceae bacterium]|nr:DUF4062 domain-containing protein [Lachnospiraceae bacterium]
MRKKLQVFVSSTFTDLVEERQAAVEAILDAGHIPAGMELFKGGKSKLKTIYNWIDNSDVYLLLLGGRYGSVDEESGLSFTQCEYEYALSKGMPVFEIVLADSFLCTKAALSSRNEIFEKVYRKKYEKFKSSILLSKSLRFAKNTDNIIAHIHAMLNDIFFDEDYKLVGWIRANNSNDDLSLCSEKQLRELNLKYHKEILYRRYPFDMSEFANIVCECTDRSINVDGIYDTFHRVVELFPQMSGLTKIVTTNIMKYSFLSKNHQSFGIRFEATKQQAESFVIEKLIINEKNYDDELKVDITKNEDRGQLIYEVKSQESIKIPNVPCNIYYQNSYICPALDFYQAYRLPFPCKNFSVNIFLRDDMSDNYSILASTFSSFSNVHSDDYRASEMKNFNSCYLTLPSWSLAGAGYVVTIKQKSQDNHI